MDIDLLPEIVLVLPQQGLGGTRSSGVYGAFSCTQVLLLKQTWEIGSSS